MAAQHTHPMGGSKREREVALTAETAAGVLKRLIANIGAALRHVRVNTEQFKDLDRRGCLLRYISERIALVIGPPRPVTGLPAGVTAGFGVVQPSKARFQ